MAYQLRRLYNSFASEALWLQCQFEIPLPSHKHFATSCETPHVFSRELCAVRMLDAWSRFCRELIIVSASARPLTDKGTVLPLAPGIVTPGDVIPTLLATYSKRKFEPRWHDAAECIDAAMRLRVANLTVITAAIGLTPSPAADLRLVRNFIAHRHRDTAAKLLPLLRSLGLPRGATPDQLLQQPTPTAPSIFVTWVSELLLIAKLAIA